VRREVAGEYLRAAGISLSSPSGGDAVVRQNRLSTRSPALRAGISKPAIEVITDFSAKRAHGARSDNRQTDVRAVRAGAWLQPQAPPAVGVPVELKSVGETT